jgi:hypothetical protein
VNSGAPKGSEVSVPLALSGKAYINPYAQEHYTNPYPYDRCHFDTGMFSQIVISNKA